MLEYALEMTNSLACFNRKPIYYLQYEVRVFSFPAFRLLRNDACLRVQGHSNTCSNMGQAKLYMVDMQYMRGAERALRLSGKCRLFV